MTSVPDNLATIIDDMLLDAGFEQDADLRGALLSLGALASLPAPAPAGELAALLAAGGPSPLECPAPAGEPGEEAAEEAAEQPGGKPDAQPEDELARRRRRHRPTALGLVLVAGMGLGVGGVAASSTPAGSSAVEYLLEDWAPWSSTAGGAPTAGSGYRAPQVAADGELAAAGSPAAPAGTVDAANLASRLLQDPAGSRRGEYARTGTPPCAGPVKPEAAAGTGTCTPAAPGAVAQGNGAGSGKEVPGAVAEGTPARPGAAGSAKDGLQAATAAPDAADAAGEVQKAAGSAVNATPAQAQSGSQGAGQGAGPKPTSPAK
ncbi:hypothetical protein [Arthrobacter sp. SAFR-044]|uniref:hypothetical protein n=1 Tax=Arthrobacter sp. SAFR-044 TaxID=3387278 RepID=UPI003F7C89A4